MLIDGQNSKIRVRLSLIMLEKELYKQICEDIIRKVKQPGLLSECCEGSFYDLKFLIQKILSQNKNYYLSNIS